MVCSTTTVPTPRMLNPGQKDDLRQDITSLSKEIADTKAEQQTKIKELRDEVKENVKQDIVASMR